jgi:hypothetical protein
VAISNGNFDAQFQIILYDPKVMAKSTLMGELWAFMRVRKKFWLLPLVVTMLAVGLLIAFAQGSVLAPFIYTIF